jgi:hypothetical protein
MRVNFQIDGKVARAIAETDTSRLWMLNDALGMITADTLRTA